MKKMTDWAKYTLGRMQRVMLTLFGKVPDDEDLITLNEQEPGIKMLILHIGDPERHKRDFNRAGDDGRYGGAPGTRKSINFRVTEEDDG